MSSYNAEEVLEIACQIERNGARYYRRAAELVAAPAARAQLNDLARMEEEHLQTFDAMRGDAATQAALLGDQDDVVAHYLQAVADGYVFPRDADPAAALQPGVNEAEVLRHAITMEKDSIAYYLGIREALRPALGREKVELIIREEMRHITILSQRLVELRRA